MNQNTATGKHKAKTKQKRENGGKRESETKTIKASSGDPSTHREEKGERGRPNQERTKNSGKRDQGKKRK